MSLRTKQTVHNNEVSSLTGVSVKWGLTMGVQAQLIEG